MHNCVRCGRSAASLQEINDGCPCGSKAFVFNKDAVSPESASGEGNAANSMQHVANQAAQVGQAQKTVTAEHDGKLPESYHARVSFTSEDVENVKVVTEGVFLLELNSLSRDPMVLKDEEGVYYVKIPFEQKKSERKKGRGKKK